MDKGRSAVKYLVDTHLAIWSVADSGKLSKEAASILGNGLGRFFFSAASIWEIAIKRARHPDEISFGADEARKLFLEAGYRELSVTSFHAAAVEILPPIHADPFDRILVAQAQTEGMNLLTHDRIIPDYGDFVVKV